MNIFANMKFLQDSRIWSGVVGQSGVRKTLSSVVAVNNRFIRDAISFTLVLSRKLASLVENMGLQNPSFNVPPCQSL